MIYSTHNSSNTRFLVAKYIPDMRRLEPRNIGIVVWNGGMVAARFLGEHQSDVVVPRRIGVRNQEAYKEWIRYWREQMSSPALSIGGNGRPVSRESPEFLDALKNRSKRQFVLVDGGFLLGDVDVTDTDDVVRDLFEAIVDDRNTERQASEEDSVLLKKAISNAFRASGIDGLPGYQARIPLTFAVESRAFSFTFDFAVYTNAPHAVFQHAILTRPTTVNSAAFMFDCMRKADTRSYRVPKERCVALVRTTPQVMDDQHAASELNKLRAYGSVIDLANDDRAIADLRDLALALALAL
jgi:hypothetical protein